MDKRTETVHKAFGVITCQTFTDEELEYLEQQGHIVIVRKELNECSSNHPCEGRK